MPEPAYATVTRTQGNNAALKDGTVRPHGFTFDFIEVPVLIDAFRRMVRGLEFDICEMAITTYITAKSFGKRFTALPIFLVRQFHHGATLVNTKAGIRTPRDLEGKRVGVNRGYTVTTGVWARGILQTEYGVDLDRITWVLSGDEHVAEYRPPSNVVPVEPGQTLKELLISGEIAAVIGVDVEHPDVRPLIPDALDAGLRALRERGEYPINHLIVVKDRLLGAHPELG
ncbi:MAG: ABC transporter substrate-binding protein, partial [Candidatus Eremiobacteraeota bacterium]|nr:ABC transporter substrate-binding protein [Candidatus Eremiobacteraeota bacterium]